jgi:hypothetical protein
MLDVYCSVRWYNMDVWVYVCWMCIVLRPGTIWTLLRKLRQASVLHHMTYWH